MDKIWVLTLEINDYDQYGEYFIAWFNEKPTYKHLRGVLEFYDDETINNIARGKGKIGTGQGSQNYKITEVKAGENYEEI